VLRLLRTAGLGVVTLLGLVMVVAGIGGLLEGGGDVEIAGQGRLHSPFVEEEPCSARRPDSVCERYQAVRLDLPNGMTEVVRQEPLYALARREGRPLAVEVEWDDELESATRVRYEGRWYRAGFPKDAALVESILVLLLGGGLFACAGLLFLGSVLPDEPESEA